MSTDGTGLATGGIERMGVGERGRNRKRRKCTERGLITAAMAWPCHHSLSQLHSVNKGQIFKPSLYSGVIGLPQNYNLSFEYVRLT